MLTPKDLQEISFGKVRFGGYDMRSVDEVLDPLCQDYTKLYKENSVLKSKLKILVEKLEEYRTQETFVKQALIAAQQTSETIIAEAQKKAASILNDAETAAAVQRQEAALDQKIAQKQERLNQITVLEQERLAQAQAEANKFIDALEQDMHKHLGLLNALKARVAAEAPAEQPAAPKTVVKEQPAAAPVREQMPRQAEPVPAAVAAPVDMSLEVTEGMDDVDLLSEISGAVQEIAGAPKAANIHFDDLQFGKDFMFDK